MRLAQTVGNTTPTRRTNGRRTTEKRKMISAITKTMLMRRKRRTTTTTTLMGGTVLPETMMMMTMIRGTLLPATTMIMMTRVTLLPATTMIMMMMRVTLLPAAMTTSGRKDASVPLNVPPAAIGGTVRMSSAGKGEEVWSPCTNRTAKNATPVVSLTGLRPCAVPCVGRPTAPARGTTVTSTNRIAATSATGVALVAAATTGSFLNALTPGRRWNTINKCRQGQTT